MTADGEHVRTDNATDPELFWALRGGKPHALGIVTAIEFELYPVDELHGGALMFPVERAEEVFAAWRDWTETVPDDVTSLCPHRAARPAQPPFVLVEVAILGDDGGPRPAARAEPDRGRDPPDDARPSWSRSTTTRRQPSPGMSGHLRRSAACPTRRSTRSSRTPAARSSPSSCATSAARSAAAASATARRTRVQGAYALFAVGIVPNAEAAMAVDAALTRLTDALEPWDAGRAIRTSPSARRASSTATRPPPAGHKARMDGDGVFAGRARPGYGRRSTA